MTCIAISCCPQCRKSSLEQKLKRCANCYVYYCSRECQVKDWKNHQIKCNTKTEAKGKPLRSTEFQDYISSPRWRTAREWINSCLKATKEQRGMFAISPNDPNDVPIFIPLEKFKKFQQDHPRDVEKTDKTTEYMETYDPKNQVVIHLEFGTRAMSSIVYLC